MFDVNRIARAHIKRITPYLCAREEFDGMATILLDANENPKNNGLNRYPDPRQKKVKAVISGLKGVAPDQIFLGNGSDEAIDLLIRLFCEPGVDKICVFTPTYGMYEVSAAIHNVEVIQIPLGAGFQLPEVGSIMERVSGAKLIFICSPNNPTGNLMRKSDIIELTQAFDGVVIVDEAYIDFLPERSVLPELETLPQLVILQTFSKAWGMAGVRLGMAFASSQIIQLLRKIKAPYNVNVLTQRVALQQLQRVEQINHYVEALIDQREMLRIELEALEAVVLVYPSDANFLLVQFQDPQRVYHTLAARHIAVRDRTGDIEGCLRITVGTPRENETLLNALKKMTHEASPVY